MISCKRTSPVQACYTDAAGVSQSVIMHVIYEKGSVIGQAFTTADAVTPIDVSGGSVVIGACPVADPDVEYEILCDTLGDGTVVEFFSRTITTFAADGTPTTQVDTFQLDRTTPYVVAGTVGACQSDCDLLGVVGNVTDWAQLN